MRLPRRPTLVIIILGFVLLTLLAASMFCGGGGECIFCKILEEEPTRVVYKVHRGDWLILTDAGDKNGTSVQHESYLPPTPG